MGTKKQPEQLATTLDNLEQYGTPEAIEARWDKAAAKFANRGNSSQQELTDFQKSYFAEVNRDDRSYSFDSILSDIQRGGVKKKFAPYPHLELIEGKKLFKACIERETGKLFLIEPENRLKYEQLVKYFLGIEQEGISLNKGIYLFGAVGRGKTMIMNALRLMCSIIEHRLDNAGLEFTRRSFIVKNAKTIVGELAESKSAAVMKRYYSDVYCIDDLGTEEQFKHYGNDIDVVGDIIIERYQRYQQTGQITHATSNILPSEWKDKYGDRVESRMKEMFNCIILLGADKRK